MAVLDLTSLLQKTFGFPGFRANQQAVCEAAAAGRDVLLVMPTGAGKSLCYQLPALARGGTALVISPLIALMDDQANKLQQLGLRVGRIHSGMDREQSREVCRRYLDGQLQFLFIAPERLRVPGFSEMLRKRQLALVAVDEAHCISQWGHDFRPDYRNLARHLEAFRPAPVIALTATATPQVQRDIVTQLHLQKAAEFITGFRRTNLAVEVLELSKPQRKEAAVRLLREASARPAIVYAPSRKEAETFADELRPHFAAAAYHAGLPPATRESVQNEFLGGDLEVVVATVAFGMGIDKANVRTVLHLAMPASVESYYQEIGRAGRDGKPSRAVLMYSYADRRTHEFFLERDYPPAATLHQIAQKLGDEPIHADDLRLHLRLDMDTFAPALDKLLAQGAAEIDFANMVKRVPMPNQEWLPRYETQVNFRRGQIDSMMRFASAAECRMAALIRHFGDQNDTARTCGLCDFCSPERATAQAFRESTPDEERALRRVLDELEKWSQGRSSGKLYEAVDPKSRMERRAFDGLVDALGRAGYVSIESASFTAADNGREISYRKVSLTHEGREVNRGASLVGVQLRETQAAPEKKRSKTGKAAVNDAEMQPLTPEQKERDARLREWRKATAADLKQPAFFIFGDRVLRSIVVDRPETPEDLLRISGLGKAKVERWGEAVLQAIRSEKTAPERSQVAVASPSTEAGVSKSGPRLASARQPFAAGPAPATSLVPPSPAASLDLALKVWRMHEAKRRGVAPFTLLLDQTIRGIVAAAPQSAEALTRVKGITSQWIAQHGDQVLSVVAQHVA